MKNHATPFVWMGQTLEQERIYRYLDRENPYGEITAVRSAGPRGLIVTDCYCQDHLIHCTKAGEIVLADAEEPA